jgi:hypothetical protein
VIDLNGIKAFMLNNSLAATSALIRDGIIYAADGKECNIHIFDLCGNRTHGIRTARAYSRLRYNEDANAFTALGCDCSNRVYCIDENFNELGYTQLNTDCNHSCKFGALTDVSSALLSNGRFYVAAFEGGAFLFDPNGSIASQLCRAERNEVLTDFIAFGEERYAFASRRSGFTSVTVSDVGQTQSAIVDGKLSLRMLFAVGGTVYGLFGYSYIYNRIAPIYTNGILTLPKAIENCQSPC